MSCVALFTQSPNSHLFKALRATRTRYKSPFTYHLAFHPKMSISTGPGPDVKGAKSRSKKRLIVLCDGTWQSSISADGKAYPTNVTRMSRALAQYATVNNEEIQQVIFYQPGVGTEKFEEVSGGIYGQGVSSNVRAAYGFLAHNYNKGDQIYFFGFSRGAYTARAIAGLVTALGLLTKRGMDRFAEVYQNYYGRIATRGSDKDFIDKHLQKELLENNELDVSARDAVQIVGVWDTVGFHAEGKLGEMPEFNNTRLSPSVKYGYHALSLDEERLSFRPTLWQQPSDIDLAEGAKSRNIEMRQVWFSGAHSDIGGGLSDPRLSDIAMAWMVSRCAGNDKLAFIDVDETPSDPTDWYLLDPTKSSSTPGWATSEGENIQPYPKGIVDTAEYIAEYLGAAPRLPPKSQPNTNEEIHKSIRDRNMRKNTSKGAPWVCKLLSGSNSGTSWQLAHNSVQSVTEAAADPVADAIEERFRGRIRRLPLSDVLPPKI